VRLSLPDRVDFGQDPRYGLAPFSNRGEGRATAIVPAQQVGGLEPRMAAQDDKGSRRPSPDPWASSHGDYEDQDDPRPLREGAGVRCRGSRRTVAFVPNPRRPAQLSRTCQRQQSPMVAATASGIGHRGTRTGAGARTEVAHPPPAHKDTNSDAGGRRPRARQRGSCEPAHTRRLPSHAARRPRPAPVRSRQL
jgi:hypothetical protein